MPLSDLAIFLSLACAGWLLVPRVALAFQSVAQRFGGPPASYLPLVESTRGKRRVLLAPVLSILGKLVPLSKANQEAVKNGQMIYTASRVSVL